MLKRILILLLFLTFKIFLNAQGSFEPSTYIGIHGGVNMSVVSFNPSLKQSFLASNAFGLVLRHVSEPNIGLQLEVNIAGKGWKEIIDSIGTYTRRIETIDIPVMTAFIAGRRKLRFTFTIGPYISYRREEKETVNITRKSDYSTFTDWTFRFNSEIIKVAEKPYSRPYYYRPLVNNWEFGFTGGAAVEFHSKIGSFALRASYNHALTNLFPLNIDKFYFSGSRMQVIHVGLMYMVKL